jgi:hypothetical protein
MFVSFGINQVKNVRRIVFRAVLWQKLVPLS